MTTLMISGSRKDSEALKICTYAVVDRAKSQEYDIIVGDADGIDSAVWWRCVEVGVPFLVYGTKEESRNKAPIGNYVLFQSEMPEGGRTYTARDQYLVGLADKVVCVWNGESAGTIAVARHALEQGKEIRLYGTYKSKKVENLTDRLAEIIEEYYYDK